jgi:simple sugar transport system ATP-binding protein
MSSTSSPPLALRGITHRYGSVLALEDVSLELHAATVTCLLGDNAAGKSTVIRILSGVFPPTAGSVLLDGEAVLLDSPRAARGHGIATVYQDLALAPFMSVWRNFILGAEPTRGWGPFRRLDGAAARAAAQRQLGDMAIALDDVEQPVARLSGGQRQAIAIARAVHFGARVLILDEPTASLGVRQAERVLETVARAKQRGLAVLLVTHNPLHAHRAGDAFIILRQGRVSGVFTRDTLSPAELAGHMAG